MTAGIAVVVRWSTVKRESLLAADAPLCCRGATRRRNRVSTPRIPLRDGSFTEGWNVT